MRPNEIRVVGSDAFIILDKGQAAVVDVGDIDLVATHRWFANRWQHGWYAMSRSWRGGACTTYLLHRVILNPPVGLFVDHIDSDGLNCRRSNLRVATAAENNRNTRRGSANRSGVKGVHWDAAKGKWRAQIAVGGRRFHGGYFDSIEDAAAAYAKAASLHHGEFARCA